jgi:predicted alpha/beta-fold hydrolase
VSLSTTYAKLKKKAASKPWYTKWVWWVAGASLGIIVLALWSMAKNREARNKAALEIAEERAKQARLMALSEADQQKATDLLVQAAISDKRAEKLKEKMAKSEESRKQLEAAIKGAESWDELDKIEEELG